jgi:hypothetical protein
MTLYSDASLDITRGSPGTTVEELPGCVSVREGEGGREGGVDAGVCTCVCLNNSPGWKMRLFGARSGEDCFVRTGN